MTYTLPEKLLGLTLAPGGLPPYPQINMRGKIMRLTTKETPHVQL